MNKNGNESCLIFSNYGNKEIKILLKTKQKPPSKNKTFFFFLYITVLVKVTENYNADEGYTPSSSVII